MPCWQRPDILSLAVKNLDTFCNSTSRVKLSVLYVFSPEDPELKSIETIYEEANHTRHKIYFSNEDLGAKMNAGINEALKISFDYLMNIGSDDLLHPSLIDFYFPFIAINEPVFGVDSCYFYEVDKDPVCFSYSIPNRVIGAGRMISHTVISMLIRKYSYVYLPTLKRGLDGDSAERMRLEGYKEKQIKIGLTPLIVDVKSEININDFDKIAKKWEGTTVKIPCTTFLTGVFPLLHTLNYQYQSVDTCPECGNTIIYKSFAFRRCFNCDTNF